MILQAVVGVLIGRKVVKMVRKELDGRKLQKLGEDMGFPYLPGEDMDAYRDRLSKLRDGTKFVKG